MVILTIDTGSGSELTYEINKEVVSIGASSSNDVVLRAPGVAPVHLVIRRSDHTLTFIGQHRQIVILNGERRSRGVLRDGDRIRIGTATLTMEHDTGVYDLSEEDIAAAESDTKGESLLDEAVDEETKPRAEVALYNLPPRMADGRRRLVEIFRGGGESDLHSALEALFTVVFPGRRAMLSWLDQQGRLQPVISNWDGAVPQLPTRSFAELDHGDRIAVVRGGAREILIYPVPVGGVESRVYLIAETESESDEEDRLLVAEIAGMIAVNWERVESSSALFGGWEAEARRLLEERLPGSSQAVKELRDQILIAARSSKPVLLSGRAGTGRTFLASLIASLRPTGKPWIRVVKASGGDEMALRAELFGSESVTGARELAEKAGGGVVVVRDVERLTPATQSELSAVIENDTGAGYGSKVRWILTCDDSAGPVSSGEGVDVALERVVLDHNIRVPSLEERREDLPLLIVRMLESVGAEQGKEIRGVALDTLDSLLGHRFDGEMAELLGELRRLVSATPRGELVSGSVQRTAVVTSAAQSVSGEEIDPAAVLDDDDLKVVVPAVERMLIDRVLRRSKGNQSRAARELNLSRGALIAKIKEYEIPDYRSLRRAKR
jgi:DNA-binding NtrC family response regulator